MIGALLFLATVVLYHETAHGIAAERYGILNGVVFFYTRNGNFICRLFLWGVAIEADDSMSDHERRVTTFAPLAWLPAAGLAYLGFTLTGNQTLHTGAYVMVFAAGLTLISDLPQYALNLQELPDARRIWIWGAST